MSTADRSRTACAIRWKCSAPCGRSGPPIVRCRSESRRPIGSKTASPATTPSSSPGPLPVPASTSSTSPPARRRSTPGRSMAACIRRRSATRSATSSAFRPLPSGNITQPDQVNSIIAAGRADLCALARPHLSDPFWTLHAAAELGYAGQSWPLQYLTGKKQLERERSRKVSDADDPPTAFRLEGRGSRGDDHAQPARAQEPADLRVLRRTHGHLPDAEDGEGHPGRGPDRRRRQFLLRRRCARDHRPARRHARCNATGTGCCASPA